MKSIILFTLVFLFTNSLLCQQQYKKISIGSEFSVALRTDSTVYVWGFNGNSQLGTGNTFPSSIPLKIDSNRKWIDIAAGGFHRISLDQDSILWGCGLNGNGQLSLPSIPTNSYDTITQISTLHYKSVFAGVANSAVIKNDGTLWMSGSNYFGCLATGDTVSHWGFLQIGTDTNWKKISIGYKHIIALKNNGTIWTWGDNSYGELGIANTVNKFIPIQIGIDSDWLDVSAGYAFSLALKKSGKIYSTGLNNASQLGRYTISQFDSIFVIVDSNNLYTSISAGSLHSICLKTDKTIWGWGSNLQGQLGIATPSIISIPTLIDPDNNWNQVACAQGLVYQTYLIGLFSVGVKGNNISLCTTGNNDVNQLGNGQTGGTQNQFLCGIGEISNLQEIEIPDNQISIYPNPITDNIINFHFADLLIGKTCSFSIKNIIGMECIYSSFQIRKNNYINTTLPEGNYLLQVNINGSIFKNFKIYIK